MIVGYYVQVGGSCQWVSRYPESGKIQSAIKENSDAVVYQYTFQGKWLQRVKSGHSRHITEPNIIKMMKLIGAI
jgi:hypothetical protein